MMVFDPKEDRDDFFFHGQKQQRRDLNKKANRDQKFAFDAVFGPNSNNEDVYAGTTKELVDVIFNGYNCSVFVYGATGSGMSLFVVNIITREYTTGSTFCLVVVLKKPFKIISCIVTFFKGKPRSGFRKIAEFTSEFKIRASFDKQQQ
jgi:hypothetical protein